MSDIHRLTPNRDPDSVSHSDSGLDQPILECQGTRIRVALLL